MNKPLLWRKSHTCSYADFVLRVNHFDWSCLTNGQLKSLLKLSVPTDYAKIYSLLKEIVLRCTGMTLFDSQVAAAYSMQQGNIVELPTGEGKTLVAVVAACCFAIQSRQIHILTFNDYLSKRDYDRNRDIFEFCGLSSDFITERSSVLERRKAYKSDVVYVSAKQAGFDYLKNFLCTEKDEFLFMPFDVAIVDEADSILIDEATIPLVIAAGTEAAARELLIADDIVKKLLPQHVVIKKAENKFWLTDIGIAYIEQSLGISNLYHDSNLNLLSFIYSAMEARYLIERDKDYIVKDSGIHVIDQTTGRIAMARKFPAMLHQAIEIKEGIKGNNNTIIFNSIPMQFFLLHYELLCGMTGTAESSKKELHSMYGLYVEVIPPHTPCIRIDEADSIFDTEQEKESAILREIKHAYGNGQPVLLGTQSVIESEKYSKLLSENHLPHNVLNAKNDESEAVMIADAGRPYQITISTNMAGRGVDIKLGGCDEKESRFVKDVGGLYVIGCGINRSVRIDRQLIGRAGRQGDPGKSKFFISKEEPMLFQYFGESNTTLKSNMKLIRKAQKVEEGKNAEARYMLEKYACILERQRQLISEYRDKILFDMQKPNILKTYHLELYNYYIRTVGIDGINRAEKQLALHFINQHWADYLCTMENIRQGIHLSIIGGMNPIDQYHEMAVAAFCHMEEDIKFNILEYLKIHEITSFGIDLEGAGLMNATSTCSYMIDESKSQFVRLPRTNKNSNIIE